MSDMKEGFFREVFSEQRQIDVGPLDETLSKVRTDDVRPYTPGQNEQ
jgi:hypothetical protein